jgi:hypothetical protein
LENIGVILDQSDKNVEMILALKASDCSQLFRELREWGGTPLLKNPKINRGEFALPTSKGPEI